MASAKKAYNHNQEWPRGELDATCDQGDWEHGKAGVELMKFI